MDRFRWLEFGEEGPPEDEDEGEAPQDPLGRTFLARAHELFLNGEHERALREYSRAVHEDRGLFDAWAGQVRSQLAMGELEQARTWAQKGLDLFPESPHAVSVAALVQAHMGLPEEALRISDRALELAGSQAPPAVWLERAECLLLARRREPAEDCLDRLRSTGGEDPDVRQRVGLAYLAADMPEKALPEFNSALERRPDRAYLWFLVGRCARALQQTDRARFALEKALSLKPGFEDALREKKKLGRAPAPWLSTMLGWLGLDAS